eukprot:88216_1
MTTEGEIVNESHLKLIDDHSHSKSDSDQCILKGHGVTLMGFADPNHIIDKHDVDDDDMDVIQNDKDSLKPHDDEDDDKHNLEHDEGQDKDGDWVSNPGVTLMGHVHDTPHTNLMKHEDSDDDDDRQMDFKHNFLMGFAHENERIRYNQSDDHNWILPFLQHNALFVNNLNDSQLKHIAQSMKKRYVRLNEIVIEQDCICENGKFYMIQSGRYAAYIDDIKVRSWQDKGDIFGELSLFNDTPRAATIKCIGNGFVWYLDRKRFECICDEKIESSKKSKDKAKVLWLLGCIESNDLFKNLNFVTKTHIVEEMALIQPHYKENIILQHSIHPLTVYVVERGEYFAIIDGMRVTSWVRGGIFGELALLYDKPRSATIQCVSRKDNKLWMLDRAEFKRICDEYKDCDDDEEEKHNDALYREYICHQNVVQKKRKTTIESNVSHDSVVQKFCADDDDSYYKELFIEHAIGNVIEGDILCNGDVMDCNCLQRIGYVLSIYKDSGCGEEEEGVNYYQILNETLGEYYNTSVLCDDFYHIIATHCSANDFSILYDMMVHIFLQNKTCDAEETCVMMHRNNRIRSGNTNELYGADIVNDAQQITTKQLLDKLHCFFVHSFNNGHRVVPRIVTRRNDDNNNNNNNTTQPSEDTNYERKDDTDFRGNRTHNEQEQKDAIAEEEEDMTQDKENEIRLKVARSKMEGMEENISELTEENDRLTQSKQELVNQTSQQIENMRDELQNMCAQLQDKENMIRRLIHVNKEGYDPEHDQKSDTNARLSLTNPLGISNSIAGLWTYGRSKFSSSHTIKQTTKSKIDLAIATSSEIQRLREIIKALTTANGTTYGGTNAPWKSSNSLIGASNPGS